MSTDYNYDEQVSALIHRSLDKTYMSAGPIFPLFYPYHLCSRHSPPLLLPPQTEQRSDIPKWERTLEAIGR